MLATSLAGKTFLFLSEFSPLNSLVFSFLASLGCSPFFLDNNIWGQQFIDLFMPSPVVFGQKAFLLGKTSDTCTGSSPATSLTCLATSPFLPPCSESSSSPSSSSVTLHPGDHISTLLSSLLSSSSSSSSSSSPPLSPATGCSPPSCSSPTSPTASS